MLTKRIVPYNEASSLRYSTYDECYLDSLPLELKEAKEQYYFIVGTNPKGYFSVDQQTDTVSVIVFFDETVTFEIAHRLISMLTMYLLKEKQAHKIKLTINSKYIKVLQANGFYPIGKQFQKILEPWLIALPIRTFDEEGFIINQGLMKEIPFGWFDTMHKGCGWIAAYNLLKMCAIDITMQQVEEELSKRVLLGAVAGQDLHLLYLYLRKYIQCSLTLPINGHALKAMKQSKYGILLYTHKQGAHYVAYRHIEGDKFQFYNAVYGRKNHYETLDTFMKRYTYLPFSSAIFVKE